MPEAREAPEALGETSPLNYSRTMAICFITGPEGSGTTVLVRALTNHPGSAKGAAAPSGDPSLHGAAGTQLIPSALMSTQRAGAFDLADPAGARRRIRDGAAALLAAQPEAEAIFFKYSTPAFRPMLWSVFLPLFELPEFRVIVIWRRPLDAIHSAFRRFSRTRTRDALGFLAAARSYTHGACHIRRQLLRSPRDRCLSFHYEALVGRTETTLRGLYAFAAAAGPGVLERERHVEAGAPEDRGWRDPVSRRRRQRDGACRPGGVGLVRR